MRNDNLFYLIRNSKKLTIGIILCFFLQFSVTYAQSVSRAGTSAASFLKIGVGGRGLGMGEAVTTLTEDVTAVYWNPAGLAASSSTQILLNHFDYIADISYDYIAISLPFKGVGNIGLHFGYLGMPDIERTTINEPMGNGEMVSASSYSAGISFARNLTDRFAIGTTLKMIQENLWHTDATGYAMDIGITYRTIFNNIKIGMSISNFGTGMQLDGRDLLVQHDIDTQSNGNNSNINALLKTDEFSLPILFRVGISGNIAKDFLGIEENDLILAVDAIHPNDDYEYLNVGAEYTFRNMFSLRAGYRKLFLDESEGGLTFGVGLHMTVMNFDMHLDYAAIDYGRLDYLNKFSFILSL